METQTTSELESDFEIEDSIEPEPNLPDPEYEMADNSLNEVIQRFGDGEWDLSHQESGNMRFNGKEMVDSKGNSLTALIKASGKPEQIAMHLGLLAVWESNPSKVQLIEFYDGERLNVTALKLEAGGGIDSKTWTKELSEIEPILSMDDLEASTDEDTETNESSQSNDEETLEIDLNEHLLIKAEAKISAETFNREIKPEKIAVGETQADLNERSLDPKDSKIQIDDLELGVVVRFEPASKSQGLPPSNTSLEAVEDIETELIEKAA